MIKRSDVVINRTSRTSSRAQRVGANFEAEVERTNAFYQMKRYGVITKIPTGTRPQRAGTKTIWVPASKTGCDYIGVFNGKPVAIETKHTGVETRFPIFTRNDTTVKQHQELFLQQFQEAGGHSFVLVRLGNNRQVFRIAITAFQKMKERAATENKKSIPIDWIKESSHQVKTKGYIMDYLENIN